MSLISERLAQLTIVERFSNDLADKIRHLVFEHLPGVENAGLVQIMKGIEFRVLFDGLKPGDHLYWLDTFAPDNYLWIGHVQEAARRGAVMKFLVLSPHSELARMRAAELGGLYQNNENFIKNLTMFAQQLGAARNELSIEQRPNIDIRVYSDLLGCPIYLVRRDDTPIRAFSSLYLSKGTRTGFPHFEWKNSETYGLIQEFDKYIVEKWKRSTPWTAAESVAATPTPPPVHPGTSVSPST